MSESIPRKSDQHTALRLGRIFKISAQFWLSLQSHHDLEIMEERLGRRLEREVKVLAMA